MHVFRSKKNWQLPANLLIPALSNEANAFSIWRLKITLVLIGLFLRLCLSEIFLKVLAKSTYQPIWQPHLKHVFIPDERIMPGVQGNKNFTINLKGFRGDEFSSEDEYRILAVGGVRRSVCILMITKHGLTLRKN